MPYWPKIKIPVSAEGKHFVLNICELSEIVISTY